MSSPKDVGRWVGRGAVLAGLAMLGGGAFATTYVVNNTATDTPAVAPISSGLDSGGKISLRSAIMGANANAGTDTITLPANAVITLTRGPADSGLGAIVDGTGDLDVTGPLTINGNGATINANGIDRVFDVENSALTSFAVAINNATIKGGAPTGFLSFGGAVNVRAAALTLTNCQVLSSGTTEAGSTDNGGLIAVNSVMFPAVVRGSLTLNTCTVSTGIGGNGGDIVCGNADLTITKSTVSAGTAKTVWGGAIAVFGDTANVTVDGSTISGSIAPTTGLGGGLSVYGNGAVSVNNSTFSADQPYAIAHVGARTTGTTAITNATVSGSPAGSTGTPGGIYVPSGKLTLKNTLDAQNGPGRTDLTGTAVSLGYNIIGNATGATITPQTGDQFGTSAATIGARLGPLANNGGPTQTFALLAGSPAIDHGTIVGTAVDQRGVTRPRGAAADIGAYEAAGLYSLADAARALQIAGGTTPATASDALILNVENTGTSAGVVDTQDATRIARKAAGEDVNP